MKRKLITLFVAFLTVVGFQANAAIVGVQTGNPTPRVENDLNNERGGYAGMLTGLDWKLTWDGSKFIVISGKPDTKAGSADRITVDNPSVNWITFANASGTKLTLSYGGTTYNQFVVFRSQVSNPLGSFSGGNIKGGNDNYYDDASTANTVSNPELGIDAQLFNTGIFEGFLAINANGTVDNPNLLIVVHDLRGNIFLMPYSEYVKTLNGDLTAFNDAAAAIQPNGTTANINTNRGRLYPLYVKTLQRSGRWATPDDFTGCKFWQFNSSNRGTLTVYDANEVVKGTTNTPYNTFTVKQVDYVKNGDTGTTSAETNNIITYNRDGSGNLVGATFQGINRDYNTSANPWLGTKYYGTAQKGATTDSVIPLFVLASPQNNCKVLSVSRINKMRTQSQDDAGVADQLELRDYATYYRYVANTANTAYNYTATSLTPAAQGTADDETYDTYTSLQKFAIWIDDDGNMELYPAASYFWQYGYDKGGEKAPAALDLSSGNAPQNDKIIANAVLIYNDINVTLDKKGLKVGWWTAQLTTDNFAKAGFTTIPNSLQTYTTYEACKFIAVPACDNAPIEGKYYFLQVQSDTTGLSNPINGAISNAFKDGGYQAGHDHVLATQIYDGMKYVSVVIKEKQRADATDLRYWRLPYDSVNMAAHWQIIRVPQTGTLQGYRFVNMLGDTLKFNPSDAGSQNAIRGGYLANNNLMPGANDCANEGNKYFGRPTDTGFAWDNTYHWFDLNANQSTADTRDVWRIHKLQGEDTFFIELITDDADNEYTLNPDFTQGVKGWYNGTETCYESYKDAIAGTRSTYYQQNIVFGKSSITDLQSYKSGNEFSACPGMKISKEEIDYVPRFGNSFYDGEPNNDVRNTNDNDFQYNDSLTAYTFLTGNYDIVEALGVNNDLTLGYHTVNIHDGLGTRVDAAALMEDVAQVQFIPLASDLGNYRKARIQALSGDADSLAWLYGETYKWYLVKSGNKYLSFDWVDKNAGSNREMVGLIFTDSVVNAIPVRLYQPLVGDKAQSNFLFQFYMPNYKYYPETGILYAATDYPDIESTVLGAKRSAMTCPSAQEVCFATLSNQSDFIYATRGYNRTTTATRFTFKHEPPQPCNQCIYEFIDPQWLGQERLLNLPLNNQIWYKGGAVNAWIATGANNLGTVVYDEAQKTTLTHTYVTKIQEYKDLTGANSIYNEPGYYKVAIPAGTSTIARGDTTWIGGKKVGGTTGVGVSFNHVFKVGTEVEDGDGTFGYTFERDLEVPLYYVQNAQGLYLTVVPQDDMDNPPGVVTVPDVNGVKLAWQKPFDYNKASIDSLGYDMRALQLFAISGCKVGQPDTNGAYGEFVYLPLASYKYDYDADHVVTKTITGASTKQQYVVNDIFYNEHLGKEALNARCPGSNDLTDCWRISQYSANYDGISYLGVFNATSQETIGGGNITPVQVKLSKQAYAKPECDYFLVQRTAKVGAYAGNFYDALVNPISSANEYNLTAHWQLNADANDEYLFTFAPELKDVYGKPIGDDLIANGDTVQRSSQLRGQYYFIGPINGTTNQYQVIDVSGYLNNNFAAKLDTFTLTCTDHKLPFYDLEKDGGFNVDLQKLAIVEVPYTDRNLTYNYVDQNGVQDSLVINTTAKKAYQTFIKQLDATQGFKDAEYLIIRKQQVRHLGEHEIPYYAFSVTRPGSNTEYFLTVDPTRTTGSVYWATLTPSEIAILDNPNDDPASANYKLLPLNKFCLPYQEGTRMDSVKFNGGEYPPVYLQTLDLTETDYPYLVIAGSATKYVTNRKLDDAFDNNTYGIGADKYATVLKYNIYTVDYTKINPEKVTSWIFGGPVTGANIWVPIKDVIAAKGNERDGAITNFNNNGGGTLFINPSNDPNSQVNYGYLTGPNDAKKLTVKFRGDTLIGKPLRPIWYYNIIVDGKYLTDATRTATTANGQLYEFETITRPYGYFTNAFPVYATYANDGRGIDADQYFEQAFGFRYVNDDDSREDQAFYIVSNANYKTIPNNESTYRYLSELRGRLVFSSDKTNGAIIFQWGNIDENGYVGLEAVGQGGIYGVAGGVKLLNTTGKVDLYSIDGRLIKSTVLSGSETTIPAPRGIVIVKNGAKVVKVVVQ